MTLANGETEYNISVADYCNAINDPLLYGFPLQLRKDNANIQHGAPHRTAGIKVFRCGHKIHMIPLKHLHHLGKIQHASADTVKLVNNDFADFSALNICQHSLKIRSVGVLAAESVILIDSKVLSTCFVSTHLDL